MNRTARDRIAAWRVALGNVRCSASSPGWSAALFFFPVFWMVLNSFKTELVANTKPVLFFEPTLERWQDVTESTPGAARLQRGLLPTPSSSSSSRPSSSCCWRSRPPTPWRSTRSRTGATCCSSSSPPSSCPSWPPSCRSGSSPGTWTCSTRHLVLIILYTAMNLPLAVWMLRLVLPGDAARADRGGGDRRRGPVRPAQGRHAADRGRPASPPPRCSASSSPGTSSSTPCSSTRSTARRCRSGSRTNIDARAATSWPSSRRHRCWPCLPVVIAGWIAQKRMIRGLSMGAIK